MWQDHLYDWIVIKSRQLFHENLPATFLEIQFCIKMANYVVKCFIFDRRTYAEKEILHRKLIREFLIQSVQVLSMITAPLTQTLLITVTEL